MQSRWRWPPETLVPPWAIREPSPFFFSRTKSAAWATVRASQSCSSVASGLPKRRLCSMVPENR